MYSRRSFITSAAIGAAELALAACRYRAQAVTHPPLASASAPVSAPLDSRAIPSTGEKIPVIGIGTLGSFEVGTLPAEREVLRRFFSGGGTAIDTAPTTVWPEDVLGALLAEEGFTGQAGTRPNFRVSTAGQKGWLSSTTHCADFGLTGWRCCRCTTRAT